MQLGCKSHGLGSVNVALLYDVWWGPLAARSLVRLTELPSHHGLEHGATTQLPGQQPNAYLGRPKGIISTLPLEPCKRVGGRNAAVSGRCPCATLGPKLFGIKQGLHKTIFNTKTLTPPPISALAMASSQNLTNADTKEQFTRVVENGKITPCDPNLGYLLRCRHLRSSYHLKKAIASQDGAR